MMLKTYHFSNLAFRKTSHMSETAQIISCKWLAMSSGGLPMSVCFAGQIVYTCDQIIIRLFDPDAVWVYSPLDFFVFPLPFKSYLRVLI
jgi:hypothetical protein